MNLLRLFRTIIILTAVWLFGSYVWQERTAHVTADQRFTEINSKISEANQKLERLEQDNEGAKQKLDALTLMREALINDIDGLEIELSSAREGELKLRMNAERSKRQLLDQEDALKHQLHEVVEGHAKLEKRARDHEAKAAALVLKHQQLLDNLQTLRAMPKPTSPPKVSVNGVIIYVISSDPQTVNSFFTNLMLLDMNMLTCYPYPVAIFVDVVVPEGTIEIWRQNLPHASQFLIARTSFDTCISPTNETSKCGDAGLNRFLSGSLFSHPMLLAFDYYLRLESTTYLYEPVSEDPFVRLVEGGCQYAYGSTNKLAIQGHKNVNEAVLDWLKFHTGPDARGTKSKANLPTEPMPSFYNTTASLDITLDNVKIETLAPKVLWASTFPLSNVTRLKTLLNTNATVNEINPAFEIASFEPFRRDSYQALFHFIDVRQGFYEHKWSASLLRVAAVVLTMSEDQICQLPPSPLGTKGRWPIVDQDTLASSASLLRPVNQRDVLSRKKKTKCGAQLHKDFSHLSRGHFV